MRWKLVVVNSLLVLALVLSAAMQPNCASARPGNQTASGEASTTTPQSSASKQTRDGGRSGAIHVHGHWTITVRNPDGSVSSRREFENSLVAAGPKFLAALLAGQTTQFNWAVKLGTLCGTQAAVPCYLGEPPLANDPIAVNFFKTGLVPQLSVSSPATGTNSGKLVLAGSATAIYAGQITDVSTIAVIPAGNADSIMGFSGTNLQQPIAVQVGQIMNVTVVFSFS